MEDIKILLMGKTGVGKSSFINYLLDKEIAETGVGKPVTQETKIYNAEINGMKIAIHDTKGLEANISAEMKQEFINDITKHNNASDFKNRYHSIFYCVSMGNPRLDNFEVNFLKDIENIISQPVNFIITHCDSERDNIKIEEMKVHIRTQLADMRHFPYTITPVCSVDQDKRGGTAKRHGKEELIGKLFDQVWKDASVVMANKCYVRYRYAISELMNDVNVYVESEYKKHGFRIGKASKDISRMIDSIPTNSMRERYKRNIKLTMNDLKEYRDFIANYYKAFNVSIIDEMFDKILEGIEKVILRAFDGEKLGISTMLNSELKSLKGLPKMIVNDKKVFQKALEETTSRILQTTDENEHSLKLQLVNAFDSVNKEYRVSALRRQKLSEALSRMAEG